MKLKTIVYILHYYTLNTFCILVTTNYVLNISMYTFKYLNNLNALVIVAIYLYHYITNTIIYNNVVMKSNCSLFLCRYYIK